MNVISCPKAYQSAFRDACFVLSGLSAASGADIGIESLSPAGVLGVKRVYGAEASVNVAPYIRRLLAPVPLCGVPMKVYTAPKRSAACRVSAEGKSSPAIYLTAGSEDAPLNAIVSAAPGVLKIRFGETDEISVIAYGSNMRAVIKFRHNGIEYADRSQPYYSSSEMMTLIVNTDDIGRLFTQNTGAPASEMTGFTVSVEIRINSESTYTDRRYVIDRDERAGRRLAWVNRCGGIDYHTFPHVAGGRVSGSRERIYTPDGYRTVATAAERSETLISEQCDALSAGWLSEIFSSPAVWVVDGEDCRKVEVAAGAGEYSAAHPGTVVVTVSPAERTPSRKY